MFSNTTIALSTTMPTANAIPARLMTLIDRPSTVITKNVPTTLIGIARATTRVLRPLRKNMSSTLMASAPPINMLLRTSVVDELM